MQISDVINFLNQKFPKEIASDFDQNRIGFNVGDMDIEVANILCTLDLTLDVAKEAFNKGANLIIGHHPFLFDPLHKVIKQDDKGKIIYYMIEHHLSYFSMHTNLDAGINGVNDLLGNMLGIDANNYYKGEKDNLLRAGKIKPMKLIELAKLVQKKFLLNGVRIAGDPNKIINKVGIIGGSGAQPDAIVNAINEKCDCYITGEIKLQNAIFAISNGLSLIEVNHGIEKFVFQNVKKILEEELILKQNINVYISDIDTDPFVTYSF